MLLLVRLHCAAQRLALISIHAYAAFGVHKVLQPGAPEAELGMLLCLLAVVCTCRQDR